MADPEAAVGKRPTLRVLSLGAGVQSSTVLLMSCREELPKLDAAIFADTQWEPLAVYEHLKWLSGVAASAGIPVHRVSKGNLRADALRRVIGGRKNGGERWASMPLYTLADGQADEGQIRRQCTREYKLDPIRKKVRELLGVPKGRVAPKDTLVEQWIGISADETRRMRVSREWWIQHRYPLVFDCDPPMRRSDCVAWLARNYPDRQVPRSACVGCPFHSNAEWRSIKANPREWRDATDFDQAIRRLDGLRGDAYLHRSCTPLAEADLDEPDPRQGTLWSNECLGMCGV
jgi:hypothetical protein